MRTRRLAITVGILCACRPPPASPPAPRAPTTAWPRAIDWATPPAIAADAPFVPPPIHDLSLGNGIRVIVVENHRLPIASIATIHATAGSREDGAQFGLAALTADLLDEGAGSRDAAGLAEALERTGARLDVDIASDYASTHVTTLAAHLPATLALVAEIVRRPRLTDADIARVRGLRVAELASRADRPRTVAAIAFDKLVFGAHPYGHPAEGDRASVAALGAAEVRAFWARAYGPTTTTVIVAGAVQAAAVLAAVEHAFGDWPTPDVAPRPPRAPAPAAAVLAYIDRPGAAQSAIVIGKQVVAAGGDRLAADVANIVVGGAPGSRLDRRVRTELGLTTGIAASFWRGHLGSSWSIATATSTADTAKVIGEILRIVQAARVTDPTPVELTRARTMLTRGVPFAFETNAGIARALERLVAQERPLDAYAGYRDRLDAVTATAARAAIGTAWDAPSIVVVGDWSRLGPALATLGLPVVRIVED